MIAAALSQLLAGQTLKWYDVGEYGLRIAFPANAIVCDNVSWNHVHGFGMALSGDCEHGKRSIAVLGSYNSAFVRSAEDATYCSNAEGGSLKKGAALKLAFPRHHSATCLQEKSNGEILVTVSAQAWRWPGARTSNDPDWRDSAWVNYYAYLSTTRASFVRDLRQFRSVLQKVQIRRPG